MQSHDQNQLLTDLRADAESVPPLLHALDPQQLERGAYEQGWTVRDLVAHLASIEWTYPRLIRIAEAADQGAESSGGNASTRGSNPQMDDYNARQVAKRRETPLPQLIEEFRSNRAALIDAVEATPTELLEREIQSFGGVRGSLLQVMWSVAVEHVRTHLDDLQSA